MDSPDYSTNSTLIIETARTSGASLAGIANVTALKSSLSFEVYDKNPYYAGYEKVEWPEDAKSVLVLALAHAQPEPELDWWDANMRGKTRGNRQLMDIAESLEQWLSEELGINARPLPYRLEHGGVLLKDSAVLAGLGIIGKNNLVITPQFGPRVRLRALFLDVDLEPTGPSGFDPCAGCDMPCQRACPQKAFRYGSYSRDLCDQQMSKNEANRVVVDQWKDDGSPGTVVKYCRACELSCPIG